MSAESPTLYFAYGSNLEAGRLRARAGEVRVVGVAQLAGYRLAFNKRGRDGSGKANLTPDPVGSVWGAVYEMSPGSWTELDRFEGGYERVAVEVSPDAGPPVAARTYISTRLCSAPPFLWYKELVIAGARAHALPADWIRLLEAFSAHPDLGSRP